MAKSTEIDNIFAGNNKDVTKAGGNSTPSQSRDVVVERKKKKKRPNGGAPPPKEPRAAPSIIPPTTVAEPKKKLKRPAPETVLDPSQSLGASAKKTRFSVKDPPVSVDRRSRLASNAQASATSTKGRDRDAEREEEKAFRDSRGNEPRRKTEEGWNIYKEDELGMGLVGGDTPLCPFDCDCCF